MQLVQLQKEPFGPADRSQPPRAQNSKKREGVCLQGLMESIQHKW